MRIPVLIIVAVFLVAVAADGSKTKKKVKKTLKKLGKSSLISRGSCQDCPPACISSANCGPNASCVNFFCQCQPPLVMYHKMCQLPIGARCDANVTLPTAAACVDHADCTVQGETKVCKCQEDWIPSRDLKNCMVPKGGECDLDDDWETPECERFANCVPDVNILGMYTSDEGVCVAEKDEGILESLRRKSWAQWIVLVVGLISVLLAAAALVSLHYWRKRRFGQKNKHEFEMH